MNDRVDWQTVYNAQIRAVQACYPQAHNAMRQWGLWSRELGGIFPSLAKPGWTEFYQADSEEYADDKDLEKVTVVAQTEVLLLNESERPRSDEKTAEWVDVRMHHDDDFPVVWRYVLKAAYYTLDIPEYEFPRAAGVRNPDDYLTFLDGALAHLERAMEK